MKKSEIIATVLSEVSAETEISSDAILSTNKTCEVVDARYITVKLLYDKGIYPSAIATVMNVSKRNVNYIITRFDDRLGYNEHLRHCYDRLRNRLLNVFRAD